MPRSGATYTLPAGYLATTGETITATQHNAPLEDIATALTGSLPLSGSGVMTGNLNMGTSYRIINLAAGTAGTNAVNLTQLQTGAPNYAADTGAADAYVVSLSPSISSYTQGMVVRFKATNANTGASTLNVNGVGAVAIVKNVSDALEADDIAADQLCTVIYDATNKWTLQLPGSPTTTFSTATQFRDDTAGSLALSPAVVWDAAETVALTSSSNSTAWDMDSGINFTLALGENTTIANPSNEKVGQSGFLRITQDATGSRTVAWGTHYFFAGGTAPTASTAANASDVFLYVVLAADTVLVTSVLDIS